MSRGPNQQARRAENDLSGLNPAAGSVRGGGSMAVAEKLPGARDTSRSRSWLRELVPPVVIVLAGLLVYAGSFHGEFILDDPGAIVSNPTIRHLWPLDRVLFPAPNLIEKGGTVEGRPLLNLSFALNYAAGGLNVIGYHAVNLVVHLLAGLSLFGIVRRTLLLPVFRERMGNAAVGLAWLTALLWVVHPLQTESVTYIAQRAESMVGLFYLQTIYLAIRSFESARPGRWRAGAVTACVLGMGTKEVMVTAPLLVLLYDGMFVAGSWRGAWRLRWRFYFCLMLLGWGALAAVMVSTRGSNLGNVQALFLQLGGRDKAVWSGHDIHWWDYARAQLWAVARYVRLSFWPGPLVLFYGKDAAPGFWEVAPSALLVGLMLAGTAAALWRRSWMGYAGAWFFLILAPTSSVVPLSGQTVAEHRMYLPLAAVLVLAVAGGYRVWLSLLAPGKNDGMTRGLLVRRAVPAAVVALVLVVFGGLTIARNRDYKTGLSIWQDTVLKWPTNPRSQNNLAEALFRMGKTDEAMSHYRRALEFDPDLAAAHSNIGNAFLQKGRVDEAVEHYKRALELNPDNAAAQNNLGNALLQRGEVDEAMMRLQSALQLAPDLAEARNGLGNVLVQKGQMTEAVNQFGQALAIRPDNAGAEDNLGNALLQRGQLDEAVTHLRYAVELEPDNAKARNNLGHALLQKGQVDEAMIQLRRALELNPDDAGVHNNLGNAYFQENKLDEAMAQYNKAREINPEFADAHYNLGNACLQEGQADEAMTHFRRALEINPDHANAHNNLGNALLQKGRLEEAVVHYERAIAIKPMEPGSLNNLAWILATSPESSLRSGARALELAQRANVISGGDHLTVLQTLAAAYAETGAFAEADETAGRALSLAIAQGNGAVADVIRQARSLYQAGKPLRDFRRAATDAQPLSP